MVPRASCIVNLASCIVHNVKVSSPEGEITLLDHKFPVQIDEHPKAVGGIGINITELNSALLNLGFKSVIKICPGLSLISKK
jgi:hypothetical protein